MALEEMLTIKATYQNIYRITKYVMCLHSIMHSALMPSADYHPWS